MGTSLSAAFASLSIACREELFLNIHKDSFEVFQRFMDEMLFVSSKSLQDIKEILSSYLGSEPALNEIDWTIVDADDKPAVFLDVSVSLGRSSECGGKRRLITSMYQKPISLHSYLPFHSRHMPHVLRSWFASETRRIARLCFRKQDFDTIAS
jgi:hypothetical protein